MSVESKGPPKISHIKGSGEIEQDADVITMLANRPPRQDAQKPRLAELHIGKARNAGTGVVNLMFDPERTTFYEADEQDEPI